MPRLLLQGQRQQLQQTGQPAPTQAAAAETAAESVQQLLQEDTGSSSSTAAVSTTATRPGWAAGTAQALASAARSATALLPAVPSFLHLGQQLFILQDCVMSSLPPGRPQVLLPMVPAGGQQQKQLQALLVQPLVGLHSMASYRARVMSVSQRALDQAGESPAQPPALGLAIQRLAPAVIVERAVARLPLLPPQLLPPGTRAQQHTVLSVAVRGQGLETVTSAALQVPGATAAIEADAVANSAKAVLLAQLRALGSLAATSSSGGNIGSRLLARLRRRSSTAMGSGSAAPGFVAQFSMPSALLHSLQLSPDGRLPALTLLLQTDFEQQAVNVGLECTVVWLLGTNAELSNATWHGLVHATLEEQVPAVPQQRHWLPTRVASLPSSIASQLRGSLAGSGSAWLGRTVPMRQQREQRGGIRDELQQQQAEQQQPPGGTWWSACLASIHALYISRVASALTNLSRRLGLASMLPGMAPLPSALALGMLLLDASTLTANTCGGVAKQLELAAEVVRWGSLRFQKLRWQRSCSGSKADDAWLGDEGLALEAELGLAARLRRRLAAASGAMQRRAVLLQHAQLLQTAPTPALLVITLWQKQLDASSIDALQRLAAACRARNLGLLLAVTAWQPISAVYREHLALSVGLRESAVVPLVAERDGGTLRLRVQTLRASMVTHAAQQVPQAQL